jgi:hypothetical protein
MAEWFFTEFFHLGVCPSSHGSAGPNARFDQIKASLADGAHEIENPAQRQQNYETKAKKKLRGN